MKSRTGSLRLTGAVTLVVVGVALGWWWYSSMVDKPSRSTEQFILKHMTNSNGTLASYLQADTSEHPDIPAGREALSESLGLWMEYAVMKEDQQLFESGYRVLTDRFLNDQKYVTWKLEPDGSSTVNTNALGDDFRIIRALLGASNLWEQEGGAYEQTAEVISKTLHEQVRNNGYFVDFNDFKHSYVPDTLSLVYVDTVALRGMRDKGWIEQAEYDQYEQMLLTVPEDGPFFPRTFNVLSGEYQYADEVNLIDQLIVGIHMVEAGRRPDALIEFMKREFAEHGVLKGRYAAGTLQAQVDYESPAVYGLAILLALDMDDRPWAEQLYARMITFRMNHGTYAGGYVFDQNTHMFDNLLPLLAERALGK